jgi:hypothetical protein
MAKSKMSGKQVRDALGLKTKRKKRKKKKKTKNGKSKPTKKKGGKKKKEAPEEYIERTLQKYRDGKLLTFFALAASLRGTTPAMIKAKNIKDAHHIYTNNVVIPANVKGKKVFKKDKLKRKGLIYWDGEIYIEQMKIWKRYKGYPIAPIALDVKVIHFRVPRKQFEQDLQGEG